MNAQVFMYRDGFKPGRMCDDPALLYYGQVRTEDGTVLAKASRVYDQWFYTDTDGVSHLLDHPYGDEQRHAEVTRQMIEILVSIAKSHNKIGDEQ